MKISWCDSCLARCVSQRMVSMRPPSLVSRACVPYHPFFRMAKSIECPTP